MDLFLDQLLPYVLTYKYVALFIITYFGALLLPIPSGTLLMAAMAFATQGYMSPILVYVTGVAGNVAGDHSGYWLSRKFSRPVLEKIGFKKLLASPKIPAIEKNFEQHPFLTIFLSRFLTAVAPAVNIFTGLTRYPYGRYTFFEFTGEMAEVGFSCLIGYIFGSNWEYVHKFTGNFIFIIVFGVIFSSLIWRLILKPQKAS